MHYISIPVNLFQGFFEDPIKTLNKMLVFGVFMLAQKSCLKEHDVALQILYIINREPQFHKLKQEIIYLGLGNLIMPRDLAFSKEQVAAGCFREEVELVVNKFHQSENFKAFCTKYVSVKRILQYFNLEYDIERFIAAASQFEDYELESSSSVGMSISLIMNFINQPKSQTELVEFAAFHAIKSIIGKKILLKTNMKLILARMFGFGKFQDIDRATLNHPIFLRLYQNRYQRDKLFNKLEVNWYVKKLAKNSRGFWVAIGENISFDEMAEIINNTKFKKRLADIQLNKKNAWKNNSYLPIL